MCVATRILVFYLSMVVVMTITLAVISIFKRKELRADLEEELSDFEFNMRALVPERMLSFFTNAMFVISVVYAIIASGVMWPKTMVKSVAEGGIV